MAEEAKDETQDDPGGDQPRGHRRLRHLRAAAGGRAVARCRSTQQRRRLLLDAARRPRGPGRLRRRPGARRRQAPRPGLPAAAGEIYVGLLAATILFIATNAGIIGVSRLVYSMGLHRQVPDRLRQLHPQLRHAVDRDPVFGGDRVPGDDPRPGRFLGNMYAFGAMLSFTIAHVCGHPPAHQRYPDLERPYRGPGQHPRRAATRCRCSRSSAASARGWRFVVVTVAAPRRGARGRRLAGARHASSTSSTATARGSTSTTTVKVAIPTPVVDHEAEYESVLVALRRQAATPEGAIATAIKVAARRRRGIHVLVTITVPASAPIDAELPEQELARAERSSSRPSCRAAGA